MVKIKICGLKRLEDIEIANRYRPDYIGFVFAQSKRQVTHDLARRLKDNLDPDITAVGVFVDSTAEEILELYDDGTIDMVQLHGSESEEFILNLKEKTNCKLKIIKAIEMYDGIDITEYDDSKADYLLFDSGRGSGKTFDWNLIRKNLKKDFFIAGGLTSQNINEAIDQFNPYAVDLSSSLEVNGFKDENKIREIMEVIS
ncbi:MAG: phosphoribosylanthranilate isomerase [Methanobrevibacter sp.]|uniref:phosphoribosylanthranilate isomerase n=1 Tax=Methanobrevibacter sp. TaxID=66852 RepID=UPI001B20EB40|nr:phosphoribosylanthranilate isomerase [Methanobrevibacter sp.]MBO5151211.1 phosphoribosylanthranilate isomerase [Methanobrevibacter sp.]